MSSSIPTCHEAATIRAVLDYLRRATAGQLGLEIIGADRGSIDGTRRPA